jgi:hypothetical protein
VATLWLVGVLVLQSQANDDEMVNKRCFLWRMTFMGEIPESVSCKEDSRPLEEL